jgi:hypothetical protein
MQFSFLVVSPMGAGGQRGRGAEEQGKKIFPHIPHLLYLQEIIKGN